MTVHNKNRYLANIQKTNLLLLPFGSLKTKKERMDL